MSSSVNINIMKKYFIFVFVLMAFVVSTPAAHADSYTFQNDLSFGSSGNDVSTLQSWLISKGYDIPAVSSGVAAHGYFGSQTKSALFRYQLSVGVPGTGFCGPLTRGRLNGNSNDNRGASLRVISPNGGEVWTRGTTQYITWTGAPGFLSNQTASISLEFPTPACAQPGQIIRCMMMIRAPIIIANGVNLNSGSYAWNVGQSNETVQDGQYKIQLCPTNGSACAASDNTFTITSNNTLPGNTPVVSGIDAPTSLAVNQTGTWAVHASDPQNGTLSYSVDWGDTSNCNYPMTCSAAYPIVAFVQSTTFTHSYSTAGTYTVTFVVRNAAGLSAQTSSTVIVTGQTTAGPLRILSPNGGETWVKGTTQYITWTSPYYFVATTADLKITQRYVCTTQVCPAIAYAPYTIATNIPINQNSYNWSVGTALNYSGVSQTLPDGQYNIQICETGTSNCDSSDGVFTITSGTVSTLPSVTIISPNGGEQWRVGTNQTVTVNISGDPTTTIGNQVNAFLVNMSNQQTEILDDTYFSGGAPGPTGLKTFTVSVPSNTITGNYKLSVELLATPLAMTNCYNCTIPGPQVQARDSSDAYFSVIQ